jgi:hypothetical protein
LDKGGIAPDIVGMLLAVTALIVGASAVNLLLLRIATPKVIEMSGAPTPIRAPFEFLTTGRLTTGFLPLLDSGVNDKPVTTNTTPASQLHSFSLLTSP